MLTLVLLVIVVTSIWVMMDAPNHDMSWAWGLGCLALWILMFPLYLSERTRRGRISGT